MMLQKTCRSSAPLAAGLAVLGLAMAFASTADAAQRGQRAERQRPAGEWTRHTEGQRTANGRQVNTTLTGPQGRQATRDVNVARDKEAGIRTRTVTETGPNGRQRTLDDVTQRTENGYTREQTVTRANGDAVTRDTSVTKDPENGTRTRDTTYTGAEGGQASNSVVTQRTENGYTRSSVATGPNGGQATRDVAASYDPATGTWTKDVSVNTTSAP